MVKKSGQHLRMHYGFFLQKRKPPNLGGFLQRTWLLLDCFSRLAILAAEALHAACRIHQLLLTREKRMARRTNFHRDIASLRRSRHKLVAAGAMHAPLAVHRMNRCLHDAAQPFSQNPLSLTDFHSRGKPWAFPSVSKKRPLSA